MQKDNRRLVTLAAGGTGGHLFPAQALAEELRARGHDIHLMTDERVRDYGKSFPATQTHVVPSASLTLSKPAALPGRAFMLLKGYLRARELMKDTRPSAVVGFGGYPSLPPMLAACHLGIPSIVHEQNAVLGRANKLLASRVASIATSFAEVSGLEAGVKHKCVFTGNPVRRIALDFAASPYPVLAASGDISVVVFGGSQGASFFSDMMPLAIALLPEALRKRLRLVQQCRPEDLGRVQAAYDPLGVRTTLAPFFADMPRIISEGHLVICRSGASSIAELGVIGRPAVLVPLPHAIDNDQQKNAESFARAGGGWIHPQNSLSPNAMADILLRLLNAPQVLKEAANAAAHHGKPDAAQRLADLVERNMRLKPADQLEKTS